MSEPVWMDPAPKWGPPGRSRVKDDRLEAVRTQPKRWALIEHFDEPERAYTSASDYRRRIAPRVGGKWEVVARRLEDSVTVGVFARYMGPDE